MKITRTITAEVKRCQDCPYFMTNMDGPTCLEIERITDDWTKALIYPEGRDGIHPDCPFLEKEAPADVKYRYMKGEDCGFNDCNGYYKETSIHDDWDGTLHCSECNHQTNSRIEIK